GFIGSMVLLLAFGLLLIRLVRLGTQVKHPFGSRVAAGAAGIYLIHIFINIGMVTGLLPVIGIPLPFVSYGGSALLANTTMLAIMLNLQMRRDDFSIYGYWRHVAPVRGGGARAARSGNGHRGPRWKGRVP